MDISSILLPREKYPEESKKYTGVYSTFEITNNKQILFYFGANHSRDLKNAQYPALKEYWNKFLDITKDRPKIVFMEGGLRSVMKSEEEAILTGSEGNLITLFSHQAGITVKSPDLGPEDLLTKLPLFSKEEAFLYWFLGWLDNYQKHADPKPDFIQSVEKWFENQRQKDRWVGVDISLTGMKDLYKKVLGKEFDEKQSNNDLVNPNRSETKINKISRAYSDLREINIVSEIKNEWDKGSSVFVVFGRGHLIIQKPALEELLK